MNTHPIRRSVQTASLAAAILAISGCETTAPTATEPAAARFVLVNTPVHSVTGYGRLESSTIGSPDETYGFNVRKDAAGEVSGRIDVRLGNPAVSFSADATCLQVSGNMAWIEGVVTRSDATVIPVGETVFIRVRDNGEGDAAQPDAVSFLFYGSFIAGRCASQFGAGAPWQLTKGNVQVR